jgi:hypothetical protein
MKILFGIQGTGNGHISRAREIVPLLQQYGEVDLIVSGTEAEVSLSQPLFCLHRSLDRGRCAPRMTVWPRRVVFNRRGTGHVNLEEITLQTNTSCWTCFNTHHKSCHCAEQLARAKMLCRSACRLPI